MTAPIHPKNPESRVKLFWQEGTQSDVYVRTHGPFTVDEPAVVGGTDTGPRPTEYLMIGYVG
ncbi:MAG: hypothetical protein HYX92_20515 [Chloroflexi bacterium]|nr:hypothetical protein [Chloroflexota bacterium]